MFKARASIVFRLCRILCLMGVLCAACSSGTTANSNNGGSLVNTGPGAPPLSWLHVVDPTNGVPYLADSNGRRVILRGVAAVGLEDVAYPNANGKPAIFPVDPSSYEGKCPSATPLYSQPALCEVNSSASEYSQPTTPGSNNDFAEMRALGFNLVRLVLNWSELEPTPGQYSTNYLNRVSQVVSWASQQGIYVILDMHQDQYSRYILPEPANKASSTCTPSGGSDGAPKWAVFTDGKSACSLFGQSALNPASSAAFYEFWHNHKVTGPNGQSPGSGLEDHYIGALASLAKRFSSNSDVLGYELMNEPQPGSIASLPIANIYQASSNDLYPFYKRAIEALTGVRDSLPTCPLKSPTGTDCAYPQLANVSKQAILFEPMAYRNLLDFSPQVSTTFSSYRNLVYAPHVYTHAFTADQFIGYTPQNSPYPPSYTFGYQSADSDAIAMRSAVLTTEYGAGANTDSYILSGETAAQDESATGGTLWAWKGLSSSQGSCWCVRWQYSSYSTTSDGTNGSGNPSSKPSPNDILISSRATYLERIYPRYIDGTLSAYGYDPTTKSFALVVTASKKITPGNYGDDTEIYIPSTVGASASVSGSAKLDGSVSEPDGSRLIYVVPTGGSYIVTVGSNASELSAVEAEANSPLTPISEVQARGLLQSALNTALNSSVAAIKQKAQLASVVAQLALGSQSDDPNLKN
ncbi:MAG: cellulase family glycosylhydrolase [Acidimicrobiales bacterium]|nr:cellulase family glycosylhydrolase [Acidimicrobiales bacterium]